MNNYIKRQGVDSDAAYARIAIIRRHLREMEQELNATNTVDVVGEHMDNYNEGFLAFKRAVLNEEMLIAQGE